MAVEGKRKISPKIEAEGLRAYERVCAFERLRSWRLPLSYAVFVLIPILFGVAMWWEGHVSIGVFNFFVAVVLAWVALMNWSGLKARYATNLKFLAELEAAYGDELPWVQVENHFVALERLQRELAKEGKADVSHGGPQRGEESEGD